MSGARTTPPPAGSAVNVPVIFITANASDERTRSEAASDWTVAYFIKPFSGDELLDAVKRRVEMDTGLAKLERLTPLMKEIP